VTKEIAFFDFDGTITTRDTLLEFIRYTKGSIAYLTGMLLNSPWLMAYKLNIISNQLAKEKVLTFFFGKMPAGEFAKHCDAFAANRIPALLRPAALEEIAKLKTEGTTVVIVSASPRNWIEPWAKLNQVELIATELLTTGDKITGKIKGRNCHGEEKVRRIRERYNLDEYATVYAYGDTSGDKPMLALAGHAFMKPFR